MFLDADAAATSQEPHPWLAPHPSLGPGKADQIRMVAGIHHFLPDPAPLTPASLHPLLAQPLLELCLRIPSWLWVAGGRDRALARGWSRCQRPRRWAVSFRLEMLRSPVDAANTRLIDVYPGRKNSGSSMPPGWRS